jgi:hypothetical protein
MNCSDKNIFTRLVFCFVGFRCALGLSKLRRAPLQPWESAQTLEVNPVYYLHVPDSGAGFATTIAHHVCGNDIPDDTTVAEPEEFFEQWSDRCKRESFGRFRSGHDPLDVEKTNFSNVVVMMRDPSQRVLSGYYRNLQDCSTLQVEYNCIPAATGIKCDGDLQTTDGRYERNPDVISPVEYGKCVENCSANMLTGRFCGEIGSVDDDGAVEIVDRLGFVGLTDEWELSVCLWHQRFGGRVLPAELKNVRPGRMTVGSGGVGKYNKHELLGHWKPKADSRVYDAAAARFWKEIEQFGIDREECERISQDASNNALGSSTGQSDTSGEPIDELTKALTDSLGKDGINVTSLNTSSPHTDSFDLSSFNTSAPSNASNDSLASTISFTANINPILYLHVPQTGSGFATTIAHHACGGVLPENESVSEPRDFLKKWSGSCDQSLFKRFQSGHDPLRINETDLPNVVVMMREPSQRILSGYFNGLDSCWDMMKKYNCQRVDSSSNNTRCRGDTETRGGRFVRDPTKISPLEYAKCVENCSANMLTGKPCSAENAVNIEKAVDIIDNVGFVGLTDEWALSVCLWHKKFGGRVMPVEMKNVHPGHMTSVAGGVARYDQRELLGRWRSEAEARVYEAASRRFWREVEESGLDVEECDDVFSSYRRVKRDVAEAARFAAEPQEINPIYYIHVPLSGSSFATTVAHHACRGKLPQKVWVREPTAFLKEWSPQCGESQFARFKSGHQPLQDVREGDLSHVVMMMRDPTERVISGYYNDLHDCKVMREKYNCGIFGEFIDSSSNFKCDGDTVSPDGRYKRNPRVISPVDYGMCVENCTANMLTGRECGQDGEADIARAVEIVDQIGFVGLTQQWALSVCLWHRKFGGRILPVELMNLRPGVGSLVSGVISKKDQQSLVGNWTPTADSLVFQAAAKRFWKEVSGYGLDSSTCEKETGQLKEKSVIAEMEVGLLHKTDINPIVYLHVPESGAGFATTIAHHVCGESIPENVSVEDPDTFTRDWLHVCDVSKFSRFTNGNIPLVETGDDLAHAVVMVRDPAQRVVSSFYGDMQDCPEFRVKHNCVQVGGNWRCDGDLQNADLSFSRDPLVISPVEFGKCVENCTANMLTGRACGAGGEVDLELAVDNIDKLGFVGLTDEWELSICLWHRKFGGRMLPVEFLKVRQGGFKTKSGNKQDYDEHKLLGQWRPEADTAVFQAATRRFWRELKRFGINGATCDHEVRDIIKTGRSREYGGMSMKSSRPDQELDYLPRDVPVATGLAETGSIFPVHYLHVPRSGSGFATVLAHQACGSLLTENVWVQEPSAFLQDNPQCDRANFKRFESGHAPLKTNRLSDLAHVVVMIRDPTQRILSGYYGDLHDCHELRQKHHCVRRSETGGLTCDGDIKKEGNVYERNPNVVSPIEYGQCVENCSANMLTGASCADNRTVDVDRAVHAIGQLGFVGLTDEWALSVCLWHKRFGGQLLPVELMNVRPGDATRATGKLARYDEDRLLGSWRPQADSMVFDAAVTRFMREIEEFGVDRSACEEEARTLVAQSSLAPS